MATFAENTTWPIFTQKIKTGDDHLCKHAVFPSFHNMNNWRKSPTENLLMVHLSSSKRERLTCKVSSCQSTDCSNLRRINIFECGPRSQLHSLEFDNSLALLESSCPEPFIRVVLKPFWFSCWQIKSSSIWVGRTRIFVSIYRCLQNPQPNVNSTFTLELPWADDDIVDWNMNKFNEEPYKSHHNHPHSRRESNPDKFFPIRLRTFFDKADGILHEFPQWINEQSVDVGHIQRMGDVNNVEQK